jgi:hypothetical protein
MSKFRDLIIDIQQEVSEGKLTFRQIAENHGVTVLFVTDVYCDMIEQEDRNEAILEEMTEEE